MVTSIILFNEGKYLLNKIKFSVDATVLRRVIRFYLDEFNKRGECE